MSRTLLRLFRWRLSLLNGVAAVGGYSLFPGTVGIEGGWRLLIAVSLLAAGSSAINQAMEHDLDRLMVRTNGRPIPRGDLSPVAATAIGTAAILAGMLLLAAAAGLVATLLAVGAAVWYLALYTPLKRRTPLALAVGAVCGSVPPVIGWCAAGGEPGDYPAVLLAALLYLWQIPHFWLFQRRHREDYRRAGIPLFVSASYGADPLVLCRLWLLALAAAASMLPASGLLGGAEARWYLVVPAALAVLAATLSEKLLGSCINLFPLLVTATLVISR